MTTAAPSRDSRAPAPLEALRDGFDRAFEEGLPERTGEANDWLLCRVGGEFVGYPAAQAAGVTRLGHWVPVPDTHPALLGIATVRGKLLPVYLPHALLGLARPEAGPESLVVLARDATFEFGLLVDEVRALLSVPLARLHPVPQGIEAGRASLLTGHFQRADASVFCLDVSAICNQICGAASPTKEGKP